MDDQARRRETLQKIKRRVAAKKANNTSNTLPTVQDKEPSPRPDESVDHSPASSTAEQKPAFTISTTEATSKEQPESKDLLIAETKESSEEKEWGDSKGAPPPARVEAYGAYEEPVDRLAAEVAAAARRREMITAARRVEESAARKRKVADTERWWEVEKEAEHKREEEEEQARKQAEKEDQARKQAEEEQARKQAEEEQEEEQARKQAEEEQARKEETRKQAEEEAEEEEQARKQAEEEQARKQAEEEQVRKEETRKQAEEEEEEEEEQARKQVEEEQARKQAEEEQARKQEEEEEEEARTQAEEEEAKSQRVPPLPLSPRMLPEPYNPEGDVLGVGIAVGDCQGVGIAEGNLQGDSTAEGDLQGVSTAEGNLQGYSTAEGDWQDVSSVVQRFDFDLEADPPAAILPRLQKGARVAAKWQFRRKLRRLHLSHSFLLWQNFMDAQDRAGRVLFELFFEQKANSVADAWGVWVDAMGADFGESGAAIYSHPAPEKLQRKQLKRALCACENGWMRMRKVAFDHWRETCWKAKEAFWQAGEGEQVTSLEREATVKDRAATAKLAECGMTIKAMDLAHLKELEEIEATHSAAMEQALQEQATAAAAAMAEKEAELQRERSRGLTRELAASTSAWQTLTATSAVDDFAVSRSHRVKAVAIQTDERSHMAYLVSGLQVWPV
jgi:hypothetical protein